MKSHVMGGCVALAVFSTVLLTGCEPQKATEQAATAGSYIAIDKGILVSPAQGQAKAVRFQVFEEDTLRVTALPHDNLNSVADSLIVVAESSAPFELETLGNTVVLKTNALRATVSLVDGTYTLENANGEVLLDTVNSGEFGPVTEDPITPASDSYAIRQQWNLDTEEGFYGLGQHQNGQVNYAGENVELATHNLQISIPYVVSTKNYGVLWDNASITRFGDPAPSTPIKDSFTLFDVNGEEGALTAYYYDGDELLLTQTEADLDYQFFDNNSVREIPFPEALGDVTQPRIVWKGKIRPNHSGLHKFRMYSSGYASLSIDGEELLNRWRMNWNPWFHTADVTLDAEKAVDFEVNWDSQGGFFRLLHNDPLPNQEQYSLSLASETAKSIDYYVVVGDSYDDVISGYRELSGKSVMLPKWAYGFWQSRERYKSQGELIEALNTYRELEIPIDNIVLDWSYWPQDAWGSHDFDEEHFPNPAQMVANVHDLNANIMISVWPKFYSTTANYAELDQKGFMLNKNVTQEGNLDWIGEGYLNGFYDPYPEESQAIFWRQLEEKLNVIGIDAWWLDASEPDIHSNLSYWKRKEIMSPQSIGSGAEYFNSYALANAEGVYNGERQTDGHKRSFILTRSGFAGIQRTGSTIWSGDTVPRWSNLKEQIAAGLGTSLAGMPNWTMDIGGFTPENHYRYNNGKAVGHYSEMAQEHQQEWQELNVRWFQFGAFVPLFRSHGQNPYREIYNLADSGSVEYESLVYYTKLRYRLMPYIYSLAGDIYHKDGTMMRGLVMDFGDDEVARNLNDAYLFGPSLLINPVYEYKARTRDVYLPGKGTWYDFYTGEVYSGGQTITAKAPLERMPLYVRAGSIIPTGEALQYVYDKPEGAYTLNVFTGADGEFEIYHDDGKSYNYEDGGYTYTPISYNEATGELTIGARRGEFEGMVSSRSYHIRFIAEGESLADFNSTPDTSVVYTGEAVTVSRNQ